MLFGSKVDSLEKLYEGITEDNEKKAKN